MSLFDTFINKTSTTFTTFTHPLRHNSSSRHRPNRPSPLRKPVPLYSSTEDIFEAPPERAQDAASVVKFLREYQSVVDKYNVQNVAKQQQVLVRDVSGRYHVSQERAEAAMKCLCPGIQILEGSERDPLVYLDAVNVGVMGSGSAENNAPETPTIARYQRPAYPPPPQTQTEATENVVPEIINVTPPTPTPASEHESDMPAASPRGRTPSILSSQDAVSMASREERLGLPFTFRPASCFSTDTVTIQVCVNVIRRHRRKPSESGTDPQPILDRSGHMVQWYPIPTERPTPGTKWTVSINDEFFRVRIMDVYHSSLACSDADRPATAFTFDPAEQPSLPKELREAAPTSDIDAEVRTVLEIFPDYDAVYVRQLFRMPLLDGDCDKVVNYLFTERERDGMTRSVALDPDRRERDTIGSWSACVGFGEERTMRRRNSDESLRSGADPECAAESLGTSMYAPEDSVPSTPISNAISRQSSTSTVTKRSSYATAREDVVRGDILPPIIQSSDWKRFSSATMSSVKNKIMVGASMSDVVG